MKPIQVIVLNRRLTDEEIGQKMTRTVTVEDWRPCSDGNMRDYYSTSKRTLYGELRNPRRNKKAIPGCKYSYIYDYVSGGRDPENNPKDLSAIIMELFTVFNIHEFKTNLQDESIVNTLEDYFLALNLKINYNGWSEKHKISSVSVNNWSLECKRKDTEVKSIDEINEKLQKDQDSELDALIQYWMGGNLSIFYTLNLDFSQIDPKETIQDYLKRIKIKVPTAKTVEEAYDESSITLENLQAYIKSKNSILNASQMSPRILGLLFDFDSSLIHRFSQETLPIEIRRKYIPNQIDVKSLKPDQLQPTDLDNVLNDIVLDTSPNIFKPNDYRSYFDSFLQDREASLKIVRVINIPFGWAYREGVRFTNATIANGLLTNDEVRDVLLDEPRCELRQIVEYDFNYDSVELVTKLLGHLAASKVFNDLKVVNKAISKVRAGGVGDDKILEALRENNFNFRIDSDNALETFNDFGISRITIADLSSRVQTHRNFEYLQLANSIDENEASNLYNEILSTMKEKISKKEYISKVPKYRQIYGIMVYYENPDILFSILPEEDKEEAKREMIEHIKELNEVDQLASAISRLMKKIITTLAESFTLTNKDIIAISTKAMDMGMSRDALRKIFEENIAEQDKESILSSFDKANFYPCPKDGWGNDKENRPFITLESGENWGYVKDTVKAGKKCFMKITTDLAGESKGKIVPVDNLSKWLFGVPGQRGHIILSSYDRKIRFPKNTPQEAMTIVYDALVAARKKKMTITTSDIAKATKVIPSHEQAGKTNSAIAAHQSNYTLDG